MILDNVSFQNCDLKNCFFLNSKVDKTEFRNCLFPQNKNRKYINEIEGKSKYYTIFFLFPYFLFFFVPLIPKIDNFSLIYLFAVMLLFLPLYLPYINYLFHPIEYFLCSRIIDKSKVDTNVRNFHYHYCIADEIKIHKRLKKFKEEEKTEIQDSIEALVHSYRQIKENFDRKDYQAGGDFFYSQRYNELLSRKNKSIFEIGILNLHYFVNGFGERILRPFTLFVITICLFTFLPLIPNKDYISTASTPMYLIKNYNKNKQINRRNFMNLYNVNLPYNENDMDTNILWGYTNNKNFSNTSTQKILKLDGEEESSDGYYYYNLKLNFIKSLSNIIYPFTPESSKWFLNKNPKTIIISYIQSILLWFFIIATILAIKNRIKR